MIAWPNGLVPLVFLRVPGSGFDVVSENFISKTDKNFHITSTLSKIYR